MSLRDLLSFNLFLQLTDGLVSYQSFVLGAVEANPVVAAAIVNWGMVWGLALQQDAGVPTVAPDICFQTQQRVHWHTQGIDRDGLGVRVHHYRLSLAALFDNTVDTPLTPLVALYVSVGVDPSGLQSVTPASKVSSGCACQCRSFTACFP